MLATALFNRTRRLPRSCDDSELGRLVESGNKARVDLSHQRRSVWRSGMSDDAALRRPAANVWRDLSWPL
jgi:hypothetical protein